MMEPSNTNDVNISEDESDVISLHLHVSESEDSNPESSKEDAMLESEEQIPNKFVDMEDKEAFKDKLEGNPEEKMREEKPEEIDKDDKEMETEGGKEIIQSAQVKKGEFENEETSNKDRNKIIDECNLVMSGTEEVLKKQGEDEFTKENENNLMIGNVAKLRNKRKKKHNETLELRRSRRFDCAKEESNIKEINDKLSNQENSDSTVKEMETVETEEKMQSAQIKKGEFENEEPSNKDSNKIIEECDLAMSGTGEVPKKQGEEEFTKENEDNRMIGNVGKLRNKSKKKHKVMHGLRRSTRINSLKE